MNDFREGFSAIPRHLFGTLTAYELAVVAAIHSRYPNAYPSHHLLAHDAGMSVSSAQRTLLSLQEKGLVEIRSGKDEGKTNDYILTTAFLKGVGQSDRGGRSERPTGVGQSDRRSRTTEVDQEKENNLRRSAPKEGTDVGLGSVGALPDDEPEPRAPTTWPLTHKGTADYFQHEARALRAHGEGERLGRILRGLHKEDGYSWDQVQGMVRYFFTNHAQEIRAAKREYTAVAIFQNNLQRIKNADPKPITYKPEQAANTAAFLERSKKRVGT